MPQQHEDVDMDLPDFTDVLEEAEQVSGYLIFKFVLEPVNLT